MLLTDHDIYLFREGTYVRAYEKLGAHSLSRSPDREQGTHFALWAPNAASVSVVGDFNGWDPLAHPLRRRANGTRSVSVTVRAGTTLHFRYLADGGMWFDDDSVPAGGGADRAVTA